MILTIPREYCRFIDDKHLREFARRLFKEHKEIEIVKFKTFGGTNQVYFREEVLKN